MDSNISESTTLFLNYIQGNNQVNRMIKYHQFLLVEPQSAIKIKDKMASQAIQNGLIAHYEKIMRLSGNTVVQKIGVYKQLRQKFVHETNRVKAQAQQFQSIDKAQQQVKSYLVIAGIYKKAGDYQEASEYYKKVFRAHKENQFLKKQQYFEQWALSTFYNQNWAELMTFISCELDASVRKNLVNLAIIQDLKLIEMKRPNNFQNLIGLKFSLEQIQKNEVLSIQELGFIYSLNLVAHKSRAEMRKYIKWSSKLQYEFVRAQYSQFLNSLRTSFLKFRFNPFIKLVYQQLIYKIEVRVVQQILDSYANVQFARVKQLSGIQENKLLQLVRNRQNKQYLIEPFRASIVNAQQGKINQEFLNQAKKYNRFISQKYEQQKIKSFQLEDDFCAQKRKRVDFGKEQNVN